MELRIISSRDARRRRVLVEESRRADSGAASHRRKRCSAPRYTDDALQSVQRPLAGLIPHRRWTLLVIGLTALVPLLTIQLLFGWLMEGRFPLPRTQLPMLDARQPASLAGWFQAICFLIAAVYSGLIFAMRAHRLDDFRGRYRVWWWAMMAFLWVNLDLSCQVHRSLAAVAGVGAQQSGRAQLEGLWPLCYTGVFGSLGLRLLLELRAAPVARCLLLSSASCWLALLLLFWWPGLHLLGQLAGILQSLLAMLGSWSLALSTMVYARHVYLDAQGELPHREPWRPNMWPRRWGGPGRLTGGRQATGQGTSAADGETQQAVSIRMGADKPVKKVRPAQAAAAQVSRKPAVADQAARQPAAALACQRSGAPAVSADAEGDEGQVDQAGRPLTRADKRRLRKEKRRQGRAA